MGDWIIVLARSAERALLNLDRDSQQKIRAALGELMRGDVKKLQGRPNQFRLRVGHYRVVFAP